LVLQLQDRVTLASIGMAPEGPASF
jgi:hypothetical protein